jgi:hypothetical protein
VLGERGAQLLVPDPGVARAELARALADPVECLARRKAVGPARIDAGVDLVVQ